MKSGIGLYLHTDDPPVKSGIGVYLRTDDPPVKSGIKVYLRADDPPVKSGIGLYLRADSRSGFRFPKEAFPQWEHHPEAENSRDGSIARRRDILAMRASPVGGTFSR
ncbi:unnamed protein product [Linum trigynum]|uniref:Uncharacterized protein n=1 Tax=Linum trigynum TaxID=586398 RepID=A0AAV2GSG1_9ROSI